MAKDNREYIYLRCSECDKNVYTTRKRVKPLSGEEITKLDLKKYCKVCKKHTLHKESKGKQCKEQVFFASYSSILNSVCCIL